MPTLKITQGPHGSVLRPAMERKPRVIAAKIVGWRAIQSLGRQKVFREDAAASVKELQEI